MGFEEFFEDEQFRDVMALDQAARSHKTQREIAALLREQNERESDKQKLPRCPYCGGRLEGEFEICIHCKNNLSWVEGHPCKPGNEYILRDSLNQQKQERLVREQKIAQQQAAFRSELYAQIIIALFSAPFGITAGVLCYLLTTDSDSIGTSLIVGLVIAGFVDYCLNQLGQ
jgi:hypothetical protein